MKVESYVFQSPYPSPVQLGRPDPLAQAEEKTTEAVNSIADATNQSKRDAQNYKAQLSSGASVNVAASSTDKGLSSSLSEFTALNAKAQATGAYSG